MREMGYDGGFRVGYTDPVTGRPERLAATMDQKANRLCSACNNAWLGGLEKEVGEYLAAMMFTDGRFRIPAAMQRLLAVWAIKTTLTLNLTYPDPFEKVPEDTYRRFRDTFDGPLDEFCQVWVGQYRAATMVPVFSVEHALLAHEDGRADPGHPDGYMAPLRCFGAVFLVVVWHARVIDVPHEPGNVPPSHVRRLLPPEGRFLSWPGTLIPFDDAGLEAIGLH